MVPGAGRQLRRGRRARPRRAERRQGRRRSPRPRRRRGIAAKKGRRAAACTAWRRPVRHRCRLRGSVLERRLRACDEPGAMSLPWRPRRRCRGRAGAAGRSDSPSRRTATSSRTSLRSGWAARCLGGLLGASGRSRSASGGTTMRSIARATPSTSAGQARRPSRDSGTRSAAGPPARSRSGRLRVVGGQLGPQLRLLLDQAGRADQREEPRRLVPAAAATWRSVSRAAVT